MTEQNLKCISLDIDWAPEFVVEEVANLLIERELKATWFLTDPMPCLDHELFERGIHPLFASGGIGDALKAAFRNAPDARSSRSHSLFQSTPILAALAKTQITHEVSLHLPDLDYDRPFTFEWKGATLQRLATCWDDSFTINSNQPDFFPQAKLLRRGGVQIFAFHPIHVYMNTRSYDDYVSVATKIRNGQPSDIPRFKGIGVRTAFLNLLKHLDKTTWIKDLRGD